MADPASDGYLLSPSPTADSNKGSKCSQCALLQSCIPRSLADSNLLATFETAVAGNVVLEAGEPLASHKAPLDHIYVVKSGSLKSSAPSNPENVQTFAFPQHIVGADGIKESYFTADTFALERSMACAINYRKLLDLMTHFPKVKQHFIAAISSQFQETIELFSIIRAGTVQQRVAAFLLHVSDQYAQQRRAPTDFVLPMGRADISMFLGVSPESLSRALTALSKKNLIQVINRRVTLVDKDALSTLLLTR